MPARCWSEDQLNGFAEAAQSLKLYRRAELLNEAGNRPIIEDLYVDPLPDKQVLTTILRPNTTFVIGRKGTGKSTIFQRSQHAIRQQKHAASAYIDIKTVYEQSEADPALLTATAQVSQDPTSTYIRKLALFRRFALHILSELRRELDKQIQSSLLARARERIFSSSKELFEGLDDLLTSVEEAQFETAAAERVVTTKDTNEASANQCLAGSTEGRLSANPSARAAVSVELSQADLSRSEFNYADTLLRVFDIKQLITELRTLLAKFRVHRLYLFIDDFSELPEDAMKFVVDTLIGPLNNWSEELVKFKIAAYPGRLYFGPIDRTKIDELYLDIYKLYGHADVPSMEKKAIEFSTRLVQGRIRHYCKCDFDEFFDGNDTAIWRALFSATMANPRNLGNVLHYLHQFYLIYGKRITTTAIADAARRYYEEKIESYFALSKFTHETFGEKSSVYSLKELLEGLVSRARELRNYKESHVVQQISGRTYSSHFHVMSKFESVVSTLELNFFLTKYYEMKDRDGRDVSVFALNYGLCSKYSIRFGRPLGFREARLYFVERIFDYTPIVQAYLRTNQEIRCGGCQKTYSLEELEALRMYGMQCPGCRSGVCEVTNLSRKYEPLIKAVDASLLLPSTELGILQTLHTEGQGLYASTIAQELDCSYQLVGKRGRALAERDLVVRGRDQGRRRIFSMTDKAAKAYFVDMKDADLEVSNGMDELEE